MHRRESKIGSIFDIFNVIFLCLLGLITLYPFVYIASVSISDINAIIRQSIYLWPVGFSLDAYSLVFSDVKILMAYFNTLWYTGIGTFINVIIVTLAAYPLSRKYYSQRNWIMIYFAITMFFSGGLVPTYLLVNQLGLYNTRWAIILPGAVSVWNLVIARVFFTNTIPQELTDAAKIDGAGEFMIYLKIVLPLSKAIMAVLVLYSGVAHWNNFFGPLIYLVDQDKFPLSLYLRRVLITGINIEAEMRPDLYTDSIKNQAILEQVKHATIMVTMLPIMCSYPFLQKYFVKGVMIGSLKG